jgi:hypothetical protein
MPRSAEENAMMTRRGMLGGAAGIAAAGTASAAGAEAIPERVFLHHVYFWLKAPGSADDRARLVAGLQKLAAAPDISWSHIGVAAPSDRDVVDDSYSVSWLVFFADKAAQDRYQVDPIHLAFVEECASLWERVIVYDSEQA